MDSLPSGEREGEEREGEEREGGREGEKEGERRRVREREGDITTIHYSIQYIMTVHSIQMLYVHGISMQAPTITIKTVLGTKLVILATNCCLSLKFWDIRYRMS